MKKKVTVEEIQGWVINSCLNGTRKQKGEVIVFFCILGLFVLHMNDNDDGTLTTLQLYLYIYCSIYFIFTSISPHSQLLLNFPSAYTSFSSFFFFQGKSPSLFPPSPSPISLSPFNLSPQPCNVHHCSRFPLSLIYFPTYYTHYSSISLPPPSLLINFPLLPPPSSLVNFSPSLPS